MEDKVIVCKGLGKKYSTTNALDDLSLEISENKIIGLIGRNGAGKTTFLKACAGYIYPTSGELKVFGEKPFDNISTSSRTVFIDEEIQYEDNLNVSHIMMLAEMHYANWDVAFADRLLRFFGLDTAKSYKKLSRGMKTQLNIIVGLASRAPLTLLDEPTLGLDAAVRKEFYNILMKDYIDNPRTIVFSSHILSEIESLLEEIVLIDNGRLVLHKNLDELRDYGIVMSGPESVLRQAMSNCKVLDIQQFGNSLTIGIVNDMKDEDKARLQGLGVTFSRMKVEDLCINLTKKERGGFDDFK